MESVALGIGLLLMAAVSWRFREHQIRWDMRSRRRVQRFFRVESANIEADASEGWWVLFLAGVALGIATLVEGLVSVASG